MLAVWVCHEDLAFESGGGDGDVYGEGADGQESEYGGTHGDVWNGRVDNFRVAPGSDATVCGGVVVGCGCVGWWEIDVKPAEQIAHSRICEIIGCKANDFGLNAERGWRQGRGRERWESDKVVFRVVAFVEDMDCGLSHDG